MTAEPLPSEDVLTLLRALEAARSDAMLLDGRDFDEARHDGYDAALSRLASALGNPARVGVGGNQRMSELRRLFVCPYFGPLPPWWEQFRACRPAGYDLLLDQDLRRFKERVREKLDVACPIVAGDGKIHDYRACLGELYADEIQGYDFWGHTDFDVVFGNLLRFAPDEKLDELDVLSDHWDYLCGPMTLYRNLPVIASLFRDHPDWRTILEDPYVHGWVETSFTQMMNATPWRVAYEFRHGFEHPEMLRWEGDALFEADREVSFFHFRRTKRWPTIRGSR